MTAQTAEMAATETLQKTLHKITALSAPSIKKLADYVEELIEEEEDAEDIACIEARKDEPTIPLSEVIAKHEAKYGILR